MKKTEKISTTLEIGLIQDVRAYNKEHPEDRIKWSDALRMGVQVRFNGMQREERLQELEDGNKKLQRKLTEVFERIRELEGKK